MIEKIIVVGNLAKDVINGQELFGGSAANIAIGLSGLGISVGILSVLGRDPFSKTYRTYLEGMGVDMTMTNDSLEMLPVCEVLENTNSNLSRRWFDNGCRSAMEQLKIPKFLYRSLVHVVSCPSYLLSRFAESNLNISYEPGPMIMYDSSYYNLDLARCSIFIFLNNEEFEKVTRLDRGIKRDRYNMDKLKALIITKGENGSSVVSKVGDDFVLQDVSPVKIPISKIVDFTGAGDNFKAGFIAGFVKERSLVECAKIGNEMGAACIKYRGGLQPISEVLIIKKKYAI